MAIALSQTGPLLLSGTDATSYATASWTPNANNLALVFVHNNAATPGTPTLSGNGITWTQRDTITAEMGTSDGRGTWFTGPTGASPSAGAVTADFGVNTQLGCAIAVLEFSGADNTNPFVQAVNNITAGADNLAVTLAAFSDASNAMVAGYGVDRTASGPSDVVPTSGSTEIHEGSQTGPRRLTETHWKVNETAVTGTWTTFTEEALAIAMEIAVAGVGGISIPVVYHHRQRNF